MFFKNNLKPAFATADASYSSSKSSKALRSDSVMFADNAGTDDFNAFDSTPNYNNAGAQKRPQQRPQQKSQGSQTPRKKSSKKSMSIIIAAAAIIVLIAVIVIGIAIVSSMNKDVKYTNNSFISFSDEEGNYSVVVNGKKLNSYENKIELKVAADRSFAYIIEEGLDGVRVYIATPKGVEAITTSPILKVLATADLEPGVVYEDDDGVYLYTDKKGDEGRITRNSGYSNWLISSDASTVVYTSPIEGNPVEFYLCMYKDKSEYKQTKNLTPIAVSGDGSFIYGYGFTTTNITSKTLWVINTKDESGRKVLVDDNFGGITAMNAEGNEIIYYTTETKGITSYIYAFDEKKIDEAAPSSIARGIFAPKSTDTDVAIPGSFTECYLVGVSDISLLSGVTNSTYYIGKDFSISKVANATGKFSPDGKYLYYIAESGALMQLDLTDKNYNAERVSNVEDVIDFAITEKGNIYFLDESKYLRYHDVAKEKTSRVSDDAENMIMYDYSNTLYFTEVENVNVFAVKEGSAAETVKFDSTSVTGIPVFSTPDSKNTYVAFEDVDSGDWKLFYTSNGKKFAIVDNSCSEIPGISDYDWGFDWSGNAGGNNNTDDSADSTDTTDTTDER